MNIHFSNKTSVVYTVVFLLITFIPMSIHSKNKINIDKPDFAFPETVSAESQKALDKALEQKNYPEVLTNAIILSVARGLKSNDSINQNLELFDSLANILPRPFSNFSMLIEATILKEYYNSRRWDFDSRSLPLEMINELRISEWSGQMFTSRIFDLIEKSVSFKLGEQLFSSEALSFNFISFPKNSSDWASYLTTGDFIKLKGASLIKDFCNFNQRIIPFFKEGSKQKLSLNERCRNLYDKLSKELIEYYSLHDNSVMEVYMIIHLGQKNIGNDDQTPFEQIEKLKDKEGLGLFLLSQPGYSLNFQSEDKKKKLYKICLNWLKEFKHSNFRRPVENFITNLTQKEVLLNVPSLALPDKPINTNASLSNIQKGYALIYKLTDKQVDKYLWGKEIKKEELNPKTQLIKIIELNSRQEIPFCDTVEFTIPSLPVGIYAVIPSNEKKLTGNLKREISSYLNVSEITVETSKCHNKEGHSRVYVVDPYNQKPIEGATVKLYASNQKKELKQLITGQEGFAEIEEESYYKIIVEKNNSRLAISSNFTSYIDAGHADEVKIFADLSVYHPGDTVEFSVLCWNKNIMGGYPVKSRNVHVDLRDANYKEIESLDLVTDDSGRAAGKFKLTETGLLGTYCLIAGLPKKRDNNNGQPDSSGINIFEDLGIARQEILPIQVADYKIPRFYVNLEKVDNSTDSVVSFKGEVKTFSGMPLSGCKINYKINYSPLWYRGSYRSGDASYEDTIDSQEDGSFLISLPLENIRNEEYKYGTFIIVATVTSPDGETQSSRPEIFILNESYRISAEIPSTICLKDSITTLNVNVVNNVDSPVNKQVKYEIIDSSGECKQKGEFTSPTLKLDMVDIPSGSYTFKFSLVDSDKIVESNSIIYRINDAKSPVETPLWVPEHRYVVNSEENEIEVKFGSGYPDSWILYSVVTGLKIISTGWIHVDENLTSIKVPVPQGYDKTQVILSGLHIFENLSERIDVLNDYSQRKLKVETITFRDKLNAGDKEIWKFKFSVNGEESCQTYGLAVMTDKAINTIQPFQWFFKPNLSMPSADISFNLPYFSYKNVISWSENLKRIYGNEINYSLPVWQTYDYPFAGHYNLYERRMKYAMPMVAHNAEMAMHEEEVDYAASLSMATSDSAGGYVESVKNTEEMDDGEIREVTGETSTTDIPLREIEMPVAFFNPLLNSDEDGNMEITFEVPNFNTTWQFQLLGYNENLLTTSLLLDAVSAKPIMAQGNYPMYLRTGDKTVFEALLFNNSDKELKIKGLIEIRDLASGELISAKTFKPETVSPYCNRKIQLEYPVTAKYSQLEIRVYAMTDNFSDGERYAIPVYPSSTPLIESTQFYLGSKEKEKIVLVPKLNKDANVTLKYCFNPIWECMLALPSLADADSQTAVTLAHRLYANSVAGKTVSRFPQINRELNALFETDEYKKLQSNLEKDASLKVIGLQSTPWVNNAENDRERILSLGQLLNNSEVSAKNEQIILQLDKLQNSDGGWSWTEGMESSTFITEEVLYSFAEMKRAEALPDGVDIMIEKGFIYCEKKIMGSYKKHNDLYLPGLLEYLYIESFFENKERFNGFSSFRDKALSRIADEWTKFSIREKAEAALLLHRCGKGKYTETINKILLSLDQFATKDESKGWSYENLSSGYGGWDRLLTTSMVLNAYAEIDPTNQAVDGIRQWLLLQKETEDWGAGKLTVGIIQSILSSGTTWGENTTLPVILVDGKKLSLPGIKNCGDMTVTLDPQKISGKQLTIKKDGSTPAWGAIISQFVEPIKDVKDTESENLKVRKHLIRIDSTQPKVISSDDNLKKGDKVRVVLTIECQKDMDYVAIVDERGSCLQPVEWLSGYNICGDTWGYRETRENKNSFFIEFLSKGTHEINYDCYIDRPGIYSIGIATVQSLYSPQQVAHSAGKIISVSQEK